MEYSLREIIVMAYNANERRNYFKVKQNLKLAMKMVKKEKGYADGIIEITGDSTHV